jgi:predicted esterase
MKTVALAGLIALSLCAAPLVADQPQAADQPQPSEPAGPSAAPPRLTVAVDGDRDLEVVMGPARSSRSIIYMHGVCGDPLAFESWARAAGRFATFISLRGDVACKGRRGRSKWSYDKKALRRRIGEALDAVSKRRKLKLDPEQVALIGYSQGASRVEAMAHAYPTHYRRVALIAPPKQPSLARLAKSERVLLMAGGWDVRSHIRAAHLELERAGRTVRYLELPKAKHGEYGPRAQPVMTRALSWLFASSQQQD